MNKITLFVAVLFLTISGGSAMAQKSGYIRLDAVVSLMPEVGKIDTLLQKYQADSINREFGTLVRDYNYRDSLLNSKDTVTMPPAVKNQHRQALQNLAYQVQNWQAISQQALQAKQEQLLEPVYRRAMTALNQVAKENGYTFVYNQEVLLVAPPADDLLPLVAKKLNIKLPQGAPNTGAQVPPKR